MVNGIGTENRNITGGAPVFVPFGSREATDLIQSEGKFLSQLRSDRENNQMKFDSFQMATTRNEPQEESELQAIFNEQRKEILAELKASNSTSSSAAGRGGDKTVSNYHNVNRTFSGSTTRRFKPGLSKFYQLQLQKSEEYSLAISQLLSLGYPYQLASSALKINRGNYQAAVDYLLSKSASTSMHLDENPVNNHQTPMISASLTRGSRPPYGGGRGSRGGRGGSSHGRFNSIDGDEMNSSRFHSSSADTLQSRPSTGFVRLDDLIIDSMPTKSTPAPPTTKDAHQTVNHRLKPPVNQVLSVGCPILAQNISGDYEEAQLIGYLSSEQLKLSSSNTGGGSSGEKIVLVAYLHPDNATGKINIEEEIVPISLIRTMNREKITIDMVPPAPADRVKPYGSSSNSASMNSNQFDDIHFSHQPYPTSGRGYRGNSRGGGRRVFSARVGFVNIYLNVHNDFIFFVELNSAGRIAPDNFCASDELSIGITECTCCGTEAPK
ncbi:unnamed protein product [Trichobilharzia regenti]|nr:unnamed protein product [Trichobilharzia regenti]